MERVKTPRVPALAALCLAALFIALASTCDNPIDLTEAIQVEVMQANDRYLQVEAITIPVDIADKFSPTGTMEIRFDRAIDLSTVGPESVIIENASAELKRFFQLMRGSGRLTISGTGWPG